MKSYKTSFAIKKVLKKHWFTMVWIILSTTAIGFIITLIKPTHHLAETQILFSGDNSPEATEVLANIIKGSDFQAHILETAKSQDIFVTEKFKTKKNWEEKVTAHPTAYGRILFLQINDKDETLALNLLQVIQKDILNQSGLYLNNRSFTLKLIDEPHLSRKMPFFNSIIIIFSSILTGFFITLIFFFYKLNYQKKIFQNHRAYFRKKHKPGHHTKRAKILKASLIESPVTSKNTEDEVKEKLNKLISGKNILPSSKSTS